jgi:hypothetical protein
VHPLVFTPQTRYIPKLFPNLYLSLKAGLP